MAAKENAPHCSHAGRRFAVLDWPEAGSLRLLLLRPACARSDETKFETQHETQLET
jgi:hypothetical protein